MVQRHLRGQPSLSPARLFVGIFVSALFIILVRENVVMSNRMREEKMIGSLAIESGRARQIQVQSPGVAVAPSAPPSCMAEEKGYRSIRWPGWDPNNPETADSDWRVNYLWSHQHPARCEEAKFALRNPGWRVSPAALKS